MGVCVGGDIAQDSHVGVWVHWGEECPADPLAGEGAGEAHVLVEDRDDQCIVSRGGVHRPDNTRSTHYTHILADAISLPLVYGEEDLPDARGPIKHSCHDERPLPQAHTIGGMQAG